MVTEQQLSEQMQRYVEIQQEIKKLEQEQGFVKNIIEMYMKQQGIQHYYDGVTNITANIVTASRENIDKALLQQRISPELWEEIISKKEYSFIKIQSEESRDAQARFFKSKKGDADAGNKDTA